MSDNNRHSEKRRFLSAEQARKLEQTLLKKPDDFEARTQLLIYYMLEAFHSEEAHKSHLRHILWVIQHHPDADLAGTPFVQLHREQDEEAIREVKLLWIQQAANHPDNASVLGNAAKFFIHAVSEDWPKARDWLHIAELLDPDNPEWPEQSGLLFEFERRQLQGLQRKVAAQHALQHYERAYSLTADEEGRLLLLDNLARNALVAEEFTKAGEYAAKLLEGAALCKDGGHTWNYGNVLHWGHITLGKLAFRQDDKQTAILHLQEAGNTPGSPQLNSFGPDMSLARELLEQGEKEAVLAYLKACSKFWQSGGDRLAAWVSAIRQNRTPDFGSRHD